MVGDRKPLKVFEQENKVREIVLGSFMWQPQYVVKSVGGKSLDRKIPL